MHDQIGSFTIYIDLHTHFDLIFCDSTLIWSIWSIMLEIQGPVAATASSSCCQLSKNNISCYQLPVKFAVAVVDFQVKKPDPTGPENST
jgi:hypothetical protein